MTIRHGGLKQTEPSGIMSGFNHATLGIVPAVESFSCDCGSKIPVPRILRLLRQSRRPASGANSNGPFTTTRMADISITIQRVASESSRGRRAGGLEMIGNQIMAPCKSPRPTTIEA